MMASSLTEESSVKKILDASSGAALTESVVRSLVRLYPEYLSRLDDASFNESVRVIVRRDYKENVLGKGKVSVISGGGSGHEPAHAGFVGKGLLTAAVCGDVFASPTAKAVACAIASVSSREAGCLLIVKNYTGDRLNFGIAAELAKSHFGIPVETVYASDDAALPEAQRPRGLAGTLFVHKVAGALAEEGLLSLKDIAKVARQVSSKTATFSAAYKECFLPGRPLAKSRLGPQEVELGLGIHNEPGVETLAKPPTATALAKRCVDACLLKLTREEGGGKREKRVAVLVNNLGATSQLEMAVFGAACLEACENKGLEVLRCIDGALVTSIDAHGASLSLLAVDDTTLRLLDAPCDSPALATGRFRKILKEKTVDLVAAPRAALYFDEEEEKKDQENDPASSYLADEAPKVIRAILAACKAVEACEQTLTELDSKVGDGDCGTTLAAGARALRADVEAHPERYNRGAPRACGAIAKVIATTMGGSSGALYTLGFRAAETALRAKATKTEKHDDDTGVGAFKDAYVAFARAIADCGGAGIGSATMCDATLPAADVLALHGDLASAADAARQGAESTAIIHATHGRSAHVAKDKQVGVADPGAFAIAEMFHAVNEEFRLLHR